MTTTAAWRDSRFYQIFLLGIASGFPWLIIGSSLSAWLKDEGLSRSAIGLFGLVFSAYSINFLWSPLVDKLQLPGLKRLGQRRSWIVLCQAILLCATAALSQLSLQHDLALIALLCVIIGVSSATQDIAIDAFRIEVIAETEPKQQSIASSLATSGWWTGYALLGTVPFLLVGHYGVAWPSVYLLFAVTMMLLIQVPLWLCREPRFQRHAAVTTANHWLHQAVIAPFTSFFQRNGVKTALLLLLFIFLFKIGEAFLGRMSIVFYKEIGFSNEQIGWYSKFGSGALTIIFAFFGGLFNYHFGIVRGMFISGVAMASSNLLFSLIALSGPREDLLLLAIVVDGFTQAWSLVAFVAFLSMLCDRAFTAVQYALLASLGNFSRTVLSSSSGYLVDWLGGNWSLFFVLTAVMVMPSLVCLYFAKDKLHALEHGSKSANNVSESS